MQTGNALHWLAIREEHRGEVGKDFHTPEATFRSRTLGVTR